MRIGLISDTHGLLRPEAIDFLRGSDFIVHAGDIGNAEVLKGLRAVAPVTAVRGNNDTGAWARRIPVTAVLKAGVVVSGHSHRPSVNEREGVLYVNPGSAGPRRFKLPVAAGELRIKSASVRAKIAELEIGL